MFLSLSLSFPYPSLKVNQILKKKKVIILKNTKLPTDTVQCLLSKARVPNPCLPGPSKEYQKAEQVSQIGASRSYKCVLKKDSTHLVQMDSSNWYWVEMKASFKKTERMAFSLFKYILLIMLLKFSHIFSPFYLPPSYTPLPPAFPLSSCPQVTHLSSLASSFPILFFFNDFIYFQRERKGEREVEKHQCVREVSMGCLLTYNLGTCPDWESNQRPFGSQASAQSSKPHQSGLLYFS